MGSAVGPLFRRIYVVNVEKTPWLYDYFYLSVWRHRWFAAASKRFVGAWSGRRLRRHIERIKPDLTVSTYPLGSAGLAWLIRHRGLAIPVGAWVSDFAPHPFWVHRDLDLHLVMHPVLGEIVALAVLIVGVVLSHRAPQVAAESSGNTKSRTASRNDARVTVEGRSIDDRLSRPLLLG